MKTRNTIYALLTVLMSMAGVSAFAYDIAVANSDGITIYYTWLNNRTELAVSCNSNLGYSYSGTVVIPATVTYNGNTYPVTSIGNSAFQNCSGLTYIIIPNSLTRIGDYAFSGCSGLTSVYIPGSVKSIGNYTFESCSGLTELNIPNSVTSIGKYAFRDCSGLRSVTIPNSVTSIGSGAFFGCSGLTSVTIPNSVTSIGNYAFQNCSGLRSVTIPNSVTSIGYSAFEGCSGLQKVIVNDIAAWCNISFGSNSYANPLFYARHIYSDENTEIKNLVIPNTVTSIRWYAFQGCSGLTSVTIPNTVTSIGWYAFSGCSGLTSVTIPSSVTSIGSYAFSGCSGLTSVTIPNSVTSIADHAFSYCSGLTAVTIGNSVSSIGSFIFSGCNALTKFIWTSDTKIPESFFRLDDEDESICYLDDNLITLYVPVDNQSIYSGLSQWVRIKEVIVNENITFASAKVKSICVQNWDFNRDRELSIAEAAQVTALGAVFKNNTSITSFDELQYFTELGSIASSFSGCGSLTSVTIPNSVTSIGGSAFFGCSGLTSVTIPNSVTSIADNAFYNCSGLTSVTIPNSVTSIGSGAFFGCSGLTSVTIPNSVTSIGSGAFKGCSGLTSVTIPNSVTSIGDYAFEGCSGLQKVIVNDIAAWYNISFGDRNGNPLYYAHHLYSDENTEITDLIIPNSVTSIGSCSFSGFSGLTSVTIPNSVTSIGRAAFSGCNGLTSVTIPNSVTSIGRAAFSGCNGLTSVTIPNSVTSIESYTFESCSGLTELNIPNSVTSIGKYAFRDCSGLTSVTIPNSVTSIGDYAFSGCSGLTSVAIGNSVNSIGYGAFYECSSLISVKVGMEIPSSMDFDPFSNIANTTLYVPMGSKAAYQAADIWKNFKAIVEFPDADVNQDGAVNMVDAVDIARFVVGTPGDTFVEFLADLNSDDEVNVADAVVLVNEIAGDQNFAKAYGAPRQDLGDDRLALTENDNHSLSLAMESQRPYTAFQFDLYTNSEDDVMNLRLNAARKNGHQLLYNKVDEGHYRVVALSLANNGFNGNNGELLNISLDGFNSADMTIGNIHFITTDGTDHRFDDLSLSSATGIESLTPNPSPKGEGNVYDLSGRKVSESSANSESSVLPKGVYVVNGRKKVVR